MSALAVVSAIGSLQDYFCTIDASMIGEARRTQIVTDMAYIQPGLTSARGHGAIGIQGSTAYDGFKLYSGSGTITGSIRVYGYAND